MPVRMSNATPAIKKRLKHVEQSILSCKLRGFSTKKLYDARSDYIEILRKRNAFKKEDSILYRRKHPENVSKPAS